MSKTKFTPGPWEWCDSYSEYTDQKTQSLVGNDGYDSILCCDGESNSPPCLGETGEANAHLIAAAPELYELLAGVGKFLNDSIKLEQPCFDSPPEPASEWDHNAGQCLGEIQRLLAKARGEL